MRLPFHAEPARDELESKMEELTKEEVQTLVHKLPGGTRSRFANLSLILKMGAGYAAMALFTIAALSFAFFNLRAINSTAREIANVDLPVVSALIKLRGSLLAQESFAGKYAILKDRTFIRLFRQRTHESMANLAVLEKAGSPADVAEIKRRFFAYQTASELLFAGNSGTRDELRSSALRLEAALDAFYSKRKDRLQAVLQQADEQHRKATRWGIWIAGIGFLLAAWVAPVVTYSVFGGVRKLAKATRRFANGEFDPEPQVPVKGEIGDLAWDVTRMAERLKELERMNQDALPLTRLPGNEAIERVLEEGLKTGTPFAFCCATLENFKPFAAHYGYAKGSELLRQTGYLMHAAVSEHGAPDDFVGHVGGDEFVMVLSTDRVAAVCEAVVSSFDAEITRHLSPEDQKAKGIERCDRYGVRRFYPVAAISICVIHCSNEEYASSVEIAGAAATLKECMKKTPGSSWELLPDQPKGG